MNNNKISKGTNSMHNPKGKLSHKVVGALKGSYPHSLGDNNNNQNSTKIADTTSQTSVNNNHSLTMVTFTLTPTNAYCMYVEDDGLVILLSKRLYINLASNSINHQRSTIN